MDKADKIFIGVVVSVVAVAYFTAGGHIVSFLLRLASICFAIGMIYNLYRFISYSVKCIKERIIPSWRIIYPPFALVFICFGCAAISETAVNIYLANGGHF